MLILAVGTCTDRDNRTQHVVLRFPSRREARTAGRRLWLHGGWWRAQQKAEFHRSGKGAAAGSSRQTPGPRPSTRSRTVTRVPCPTGGAQCPLLPCERHTTPQVSVALSPGFPAGDVGLRELRCASCSG